MGKASERPSTSAPGGPPSSARFEIVRPLGRGATGVVYEAIDRDRGARVAVKTLRALDGELLMQLKSEFRSLQDIGHPNLVRLDELVRDGDAWMLAMELVDGESFTEYVTGSSGAEAPANEARLRSALAQVARGLLALHAAGKVHRDIKPSNVLVARGGRVVILDFGLAREASGGADEHVVGTAHFMAPEQFAEGAVQPSCDWYSVGVMLYLCLAGRHPFEGTLDEVMLRKLGEPPPPPREVAPGRAIPEDLEALAMELLRVDPEARADGERILAVVAPRRPLSRPPSTPAVVGQAPFVGREAELEALERALADTRAGRAVVVLVEGESGVGKSALVRRFTQAIAGARSDALVLTSRCYARESVPYKAVDGLVDELRAVLDAMPERDVLAVLPRRMRVVTRVFPVLDAAAAARSTPPPEDVGPAVEGRAGFFDAMRELFAKLAARGPLVLAIDDLQWADADSLALLAAILRPPRAPPVLVLATARPDAAATPTFGLPGDVRPMPLARLSPSEGLELANALLETAGAAPDAEVAASLAREAAGHPLFLDELVRHAGVARRVSSKPKIVALDDALHARAARLDDRARRLLETISVAGVALPNEVVYAASGLSADDFATSLHALRVAHLTRTSAGRGDELVEPYHDRVREAVVSRLDDGRRRACHEALARALEASERGDPDALATHWLGAGDDAKALVHTARAAEQAYRALAFDRAAILYARLAERATSEGERQAARVRLGEALANGGRGPEAARAYAEAAKRATREESLDLRRRAAEELLFAGRFDEGDEALRGVLREVGLRMPRSPLSALVLLVFWRVWLWLRGLELRERAAGDVPPQELTRLDACAGVAHLLSVVDTIRGAYFQTRTLLFALAAGEPTRVARALALEGAFLGGAGRRNGARARAVFERAEAIVAGGAPPQVEGAIAAARAFADFCEGRFEAAREAADAAASRMRAQPLGAFWDLRMTELIAIWALSWCGDVEELARRAEQRAREADARGDLYTATCLRAGTPSIAAVRSDDPVAARAVVTEAMRLWTQRGYHNQHYWGMLAEAQIDLYEGDGEAALRRVAEHWPRMKRSLMLEVQVIRIEGTHLRARARLAIAAATAPGARRREAMLAAAARDARALEGEGAPYASALAGLVRGSVAAMRGDREEAIDELRRAASALDDTGMRLHACVARWRLASLLAARGDAAAARELAAAAERAIRARGIARVAGYARMLAPLGDGRGA